MNANTKGLSIGGIAATAGYLADLILFGLENGLHTDFPERIDSAIVGLVIAVAGYAMYRLLPASPAPASNQDSGA